MRQDGATTAAVLGTAALFVVVGASRASAQAQVPPAAVPPVNFLLPNYDTVPVGEVGSVEAGAFVARANDTSSIFYNPAGLTLAERTSISGSAGVFQFGSVTPTNLARSGTSFRQIPAMFGFVLNDLLGNPDLAGGFSIARVNAWSQEVAGDRAFESGSTVNRISCTSYAAIDGWLANIGVGYQPREHLRVGASLDGQLTMTERRQSLADQLQGGTTLSAVLVDAEGSAWATHLRLTLGAQYDVTPQVRVGAVMRTAGIGVLSSGSSWFEGLSRAGSATTTASYFDDEATVDFRLPFEFKAGAAYSFDRGQVELDVIARTGAGVYDAVTSERATTILTDTGTGSVSAQQLVTLPAVVDSRAVVNVAVGGHYNLTGDGKWVVHGGYATDRSPVGDADTIFTKVHLQKITMGVSGRTKYFLGSLGLQYTSGQSGEILVHTLQNGRRLTTDFDVSGLGLIYSLALLF